MWALVILLLSGVTVNVGMFTTQEECLAYADYATEQAQEMPEAVAVECVAPAAIPPIWVWRGGRAHHGVIRGHHRR